MGWRERDYARWTDEERRRFLGSSASHPASASSCSATASSRNRVRPVNAALLAVLVSAGIFLLGHVPSNHPLIPALNFGVPSLHDSPKASSTGATLGKITLPRVVRIGSSLTLRGHLPRGEAGTVSVEGVYRRPPWRLLAAVPARGSTYTARIRLAGTGLLHLRVTYPDGHRTVGSLRVRR
jgi:hypothetical protein